jgi:hypothetical protein
VAGPSPTGCGSNSVLRPHLSHQSRIGGTGGGP